MPHAKCSYPRGRRHKFQQQIAITHVEVQEMWGVQGYQICLTILGLRLRIPATLAVIGGGMARAVTTPVTTPTVMFVVFGRCCDFRYKQKD